MHTTELLQSQQSAFCPCTLPLCVSRGEIPHPTNCTVCLAYSLTSRASVAKLWPHLRKVLVDEIDAQEAVFGQHYGLNRFRQNTTGLGLHRGIARIVTLVGACTVSTYTTKALSTNQTFSEPRCLMLQKCSDCLSASLWKARLNMIDCSIDSFFCSKMLIMRVIYVIGID